MIPMFYIPLFHFRVKNWSEKKEHLLNLYHFVSHNLEKHNTVLTNYYKDGYGMSEEVQNILYDEIEQLLKQINCQECVLRNSWFEKAAQNAFHGVHNHGPVGYSSVCFIKYNKDKHTPTKFISPFNNFLSGNVLLHTPENIDEGSIIFFPAVIPHFTDPNQSDEERLILSFNLDMR